MYQYHLPCTVWVCSVILSFSPLMTGEIIHIWSTARSYFKMNSLLHLSWFPRKVWITKLLYLLYQNGELCYSEGYWFIVSWTNMLLTLPELRFRTMDEVFKIGVEMLNFIFHHFGLHTDPYYTSRIFMYITIFPQLFFL